MQLGNFELGYNTANAGIYTGDARVLAEGIPDESVSLVITDPPYWVGFNYGNITDSDMDYIYPEWLVSESLRVSNKVLITCGATNLHYYPRPDWIMAWDKTNSMKRYSWGFSHFEPILGYGKPEVPQSKMRPDVYKAPIVVQKHFHSCPKPLSLFRQLIETFSNKGDVILDFFVGSGTTAVICKQLNRQYLAFEIEPDVADMARQRVHATQPPLFVPENTQPNLFEEN